MFWRLINNGPGTGAWNMAVDEAILEACIKGESPPTLRIYAWDPPAISLGHFQRPEKALYLDVCNEKRLEVSRRPTGGRAILHDNEITFSIIAPLSCLGTQGVMDSYRFLSAGIIAALKKLGVPAELVERSGQSAHASAPVTDKASPAACFAVKSRCDLMVAGKKIVGSAQVHRNQVVLQQNSLPFVIETEKWKEVFRGFAHQSSNGSVGAAPSGCPERGRPHRVAPTEDPMCNKDDANNDAIGLWQAADREIQYAEAAQALQEGFAEALGIDFAASELEKSEKEQARELEKVCKVQ